MIQDSIQSIDDENLQNDLDRASKGEIPSPWGETKIGLHLLLKHQSKAAHDFSI